MEENTKADAYIEKIKSIGVSSGFDDSVTYNLKPLVLKLELKKKFDIDYFFSGKNLEKINDVLKDLSNENRKINFENYRDKLSAMFKAVEDLNVDYIISRFRSYYTEPNFLLELQVNNDIEIFQQAFLRDPFKFLSAKDLIPVNFISKINLFKDSKIVCHSLGYDMNICAFDIANDILMSKIISGIFDVKVYVTLFQDDSEVHGVLSFFDRETRKLKTDFFILDDVYWEASDFDIQKEYFKFQALKNHKVKGFNHIKLGEFRKLNLKNITPGTKVMLLKQLLDHYCYYQI